MDIHEFQAKKLMQEMGILVPPFAVASNENEVVAAIDKHQLKEAVLKIQVHAGGRGKAGGVLFAKSRDEILAHAKTLLGMRMVNNQTGPFGMVAEKILIAPPLKIKNEFYLACVIDRDRAIPMIIASPEGGMEIEEIAAKTPEKILKEAIHPGGRLYNFQKLAICKFMGWEGELKKQGFALLTHLAKLFLKIDASLLEINPLVETESGSLEALDAKISIDDNALFRQKEIAGFYDPKQQTENEVMAKEYDLAYVGLEGEIGCLVNGAGLAMATMDIIHTHGGAPANFLDVGGSATKEEVAHGFKIILLDPNVKAIFVNIFGGIMDCAVLAAGIVDACAANPLSIPLIVRMEGTNVDKGKQILKEAKLNIITTDTMADGAKEAVAAAKGA